MGIEIQDGIWKKIQTIITNVNNSRTVL
ncbi:uncharacterized protein G2W53_016561 [Senna tora]|uniref:Uncharacterized protein n=1 Tax=Senna tora TaxID=362788 RepID=A0A834WJL8_9FABA|nr:uncharacterized protein G2W53_016561 [Senna tora]